MRNHPLVRLFEKEKWLILLSLLLAIVMAVAYLLLLYVPLYKTSARVFIRNIPREDVVASYGSGQTVHTESGYSNPLFNYQQIIASERLASTLFKDYDARYPSDMRTLGAATHGEFLDAFSSLVDSRVLPSTDVIEINFRWPNKAHAQQAALRFIEGLKSTNLEIQQGITGKQKDNLNQELVAVSKELSDVREALKKFRIDAHSIDLAQEMESLTVTRIGLERDIEGVRAELSASERKVAELRRMLNLAPGQNVLAATSVGVDPLLVQTNQRLADATQRLGNLKSKFTDEYPAVAEVQGEIASLKMVIEARKKEVLGKQKNVRGIYDTPSSTLAVQLAQAEAETVALKARLSSLQGGVNDMRNKESEIPLKQMGLDELLKKEDALKAAYESVKKKQLEAQIKERVLIDNIVILQRPSSAALELKPLLVQLLGFLAFGLFLGFGGAWVKEGIQDQWASSSEIEQATGKPILGELPWLKKLNGERVFLPDSPMGRSFATIATTLMQRSYLEQAQVISFISTAESRNGAYMTSNIALSLAASDRDVLLIDTDFLNPRRHLTELGHVAPKPQTCFVEAITEVNRALRLNQKLNGDLERLIKSAIVSIEVSPSERGIAGAKTLHYLSANAPESRIYEYVASRGFTEILAYLKRTYEFVLIDTPSTPSSFPEVYTIGNLAEGVVILSAIKSSRDKLLRLIRLLNNAKVKTLGIVTREA
ncbi:MAG: Wzz/FepE/Etk N-terminal domain-containing protein [Vampirovibrionales bacterium]|nr:Wzz/FepE/Etk N-terminal domain-containing protein [Vampirovibrionales bacterium]